MFGFLASSSPKKLTEGPCCIFLAQLLQYGDSAMASGILNNFFLFIKAGSVNDCVTPG
jgi:hypothetical protein